jgi:hypothetical protein
MDPLVRDVASGLVEPGPTPATFPEGVSGAGVEAKPVLNRLNQRR